MKKHFQTQEGKHFLCVDEHELCKLSIRRKKGKDIRYIFRGSCVWFGTYIFDTVLHTSLRKDKSYSYTLMIFLKVINDSWEFT